MSAEPIAAPPRRNRGWLWFFVAVGALTVLAVVILLWYGRIRMGQQLSRKQLDEARQLWEKNGPRDYRLRYKVTSIRPPETYESEVRGGIVVSATRNGTPLPRDKYSYHDMPALFDNLEGFLKHDNEPNKPRTFAEALFDPNDGHLKQYERIVYGASERQTIHVEELTPMSKE